MTSVWPLWNYANRLAERSKAKQSWARSHSEQPITAKSLNRPEKHACTSEGRERILGKGETLLHLPERAPGMHICGHLAGSHVQERKGAREHRVPSRGRRWRRALAPGRGPLGAQGGRGSSGHPQPSILSPLSQGQKIQALIASFHL